MPKKLCRQTKNLVIRPLELRDFEVWREGKRLLTQPLNRWDTSVPEEKQITRAKFVKVVERVAKNRDSGLFYDLKIFDRKTGATVGGVALMDIQRGVSHSCYLGYYLYNSYWGKGLAKEAVKACLDIGFRDLNLHRIEAGIEPGNVRSIRLARSLGLRREGMKKRAVFLRGKWVDLIVYAVTTEDLGRKWKGELRRNTHR